MGIEIAFNVLVLFAGSILALLALSFASRAISGGFIPALAVVAGILWVALFVNIDTIIMEYFGDGDSEIIIAEQTARTGSGNIHNGTGNLVIRGEHVTSSSSMLYGDTVNCLETYLSKTGSPSIASPVIFGVFGSTVTNGIAETKYEFGRMNITNINTESKSLKVCNDSSEYTIDINDRIGVMYRSGDASNFISDQESTVDVYDSTVTRAQSFNDATNVWANIASNDLYFILSLESDTVTDRAIVDFNDNPTKIYMVSIGILFMVLGVMQRFEKD